MRGGRGAEKRFLSPPRFVLAHKAFFFFFFPLRCWSIRPSVHPGRSGRWASGGVPGCPPALGEEVQDPLLEDFVQVAGQAALGGGALALLQVVLDEDGLHDHVAHGAQVQRATQHLLGPTGARPPRTRHPGPARPPPPPCSPCASRACAGPLYSFLLLTLGFV